MTKNIVETRHQAAKYGLKGSRLHSLREAISSLLDIGQECRLMDVLDELHCDEYSKLVTIHNPKTGTSETFYSVLGKHWQITSSVDYVLSRLQKQDEVSELSAASDLPTDPDRSFFEKLVCDYYEAEFGFKE